LILEQAAAAKTRTNPWVAASEAFVRSHFTVQQMAQSTKDLYLELTARVRRRQRPLAFNRRAPLRRAA
jgi:hypothetical protein